METYNVTTNEDRAVTLNRIRSRWDEWLNDPLVDQDYKQDLLFLLNESRATVEEGLDLRAVLKKINPKDTSEGRFIEVTFSTLFDSDKLKSLGQHFSDTVTVIMRAMPLPVQTPEEAAAAKEAAKQQPLFETKGQPGKPETQSSTQPLPPQKLALADQRTPPADFDYEVVDDGEEETEEGAEEE